MAYINKYDQRQLIQTQGKQLLELIKGGNWDPVMGIPKHVFGLRHVDPIYYERASVASGKRDLAALEQVAREMAFFESEEKLQLTSNEQLLVRALQGDEDALKKLTAALPQ
jgi:hypothetical protein